MVVDVYDPATVSVYICGCSSHLLITAGSTDFQVWKGLYSANPEDERPGAPTTPPRPVAVGSIAASTASPTLIVPVHSATVAPSARSFGGPLLSQSEKPVLTKTPSVRLNDPNIRCTTCHNEPAVFRDNATDGKSGYCLRCADTVSDQRHGGPPTTACSHCGIRPARLREIECATSALSYFSTSYRRMQKTTDVVGPRF